MDDVSVVGLLFRLVVSLGAVLGLMALAGRGLRRRTLGVPRGSSDAPIRLLARHGLSRGASVAVVRVGGRDLVVGITDASVTVLAAGDAGELVPIEPVDPGPAGGAGPVGVSWKTFLDALRDRTVRRDV